MRTTLPFLFSPLLVFSLLSAAAPPAAALATEVPIQSVGVTDTITLGTARSAGVVTVEFQFKSGPPSYEVVGTISASVTVNKGASPTDKGNAVGAEARERLAANTALQGKVDVGNVGAAVSGSARTGSGIEIVRIKVTQDQTNQTVEHSNGSAAQFTPLRALPTQHGRVLGVVFAFWPDVAGGACSGWNPWDHSAAAIEIETSAGAARIMTTPGMTIGQAYALLLSEFHARGVPAQMVPGQGLWVPGDWRWFDCQDEALSFSVRPD